MGSAVAQAVMEGPMLGHLPVTFYKNTEQLPPFNDYDMEGRTYRYMSDEPLSPFGFGLSYGTAQLDSVWYDADSRSLRGLTSCRQAKDDDDRLLVQIYRKATSGVDAAKSSSVPWAPSPPRRQRARPSPFAESSGMTHFRRDNARKPPPSSSARPPRCRHLRADTTESLSIDWE